MTLLTKLIERFRTPGYRHTYAESFLDSFIATQIKVLREQRQLTQTALADLASMRQSQISKLEDVNNSSWKISTLMKLARAFDVALIVRFENFGHLLPEIDRFGRASLERPSFDDDPVFSLTEEAPATAATPQEIMVGGSHVLMFRNRGSQIPSTSEASTWDDSHHEGASAVAG